MSVVWDVLTDYEHMAQFISNLESSSVESRVDNKLRVHQKGEATKWTFTMKFDLIREVELFPPHEIRSRLISGDMKASDYVTRIVEVDGQVHIINSGHYTPNIWVPPFIGPALIETETQNRFAELRTEILRRSATSLPAK